MKNFLLATRPKTLLAGIIPPLMSFSFYSTQSDNLPWTILICCLLSALAIQIATNLFNDLIDFKKGADSFRHGPTRVTASGLVPEQTVRLWALFSLGAAAIFSLPLIQTGGTWILVPGLLSLYLTYGYTGGPFPLAYIGLGELFVFLFFGLFSVIGSYFLFAGNIPQEVLIMACTYGLLTTTLICVNNLRDREQDAKVNKRTLATRMSEVRYKVLSELTIFGPYLLMVIALPLSGLWFLLFSLPIAFKLGHIVWWDKGAALNNGLKFAGIHLILFSLALHLGWRYGHLLP
jgi:1,4-dihydroxy-2-naphthoate octaprenyltransferase